MWPPRVVLLNVAAWPGGCFVEPDVLGADAVCRAEARAGR